MIKVLDNFIADKIAAGEVVEGPVSIVKELVENSIDAGAKTIYVEIRGAGKSYIRVTDNGSGIPEEDISKAVLRHATSKIETIEDLNNITTLGFRGEALASIAAVSRMMIVSRTQYKEVGLKSVFHAAQHISTETVGANIGTTIIVEDLFYNTPARRRFMSSNSRETSAIVELLENYAVRYADIKFALVSNRTTVFTTTGDGDVQHTLTSIYPTNEYKNLIHFSSEHIEGYISNPGVTKTTKRGQLFFVNGRLVESIVIDKGIKKGYGDRVFSGFPIVVLFIKLPPETIDVNIHPAKKQVKFLDQESIIDELSTAIKNALQDESSIPQFPEKSLAKEKTSPVSINYNSISKPKDDIVKDRAAGLIEFIDNITRAETDNNTDINPVVEEILIENIPFDFNTLQYKGYIFNSYIIMQSEDNIYLFDQHAAHERIFYEKFMASYQNTDNLPQPILAPITINVPSSIYSLEAEWLKEMEKMGFEISDFGPNTYVIKGIPEYMTAGEAESFAKEFIENLDEYEDNTTVIDKLIMKSCKSAVKANNALSNFEIEELIDELSKCNNPFSCPHGRPTFVNVTKDQIEKAFKRK